MTYLLLLGIVVALVLAVSGASGAVVPPLARDLAIGAVGAGAGTTVDADMVRTLAHRPIVVLLGVVATLVVSVAVGQLMRLGRGVDDVTVAFSAIPGVAAGISLMSREYGADAPTVLTVQYLRVLSVALTVPVVAPMLGGTLGTDGVGSGGHDVAPAAISWGFAIVVVGLGAGLSRAVRLPAGPLVFPMILAAGLELSGRIPHASVPAPALGTAYAGVGFAVGIELTRERLKALATLLPLALAQTVLGIVACAGVGVVLASTADISRVDGYLATTPGGLPAVAAATMEIGDQVGFVLAMQVLRLFLALGLASVLGARYSRRASQHSVPPDPRT